MSRFISALLAKEKDSIKSTIAKLEFATGEPFVDSKLTSEIIVNSKLKLKQLGLDSDDTTPEELTNTLNNLAELHDGFLAKALGGSDASDLSEMLPKITKYSNDIARTKPVWGIKHAVAKRLVKSMPPKNLMKKLGYRSIDSMTKRETIEDLFAGIRVVESPEFNIKFTNSFKKLHPSDFETRKMSVSYASNKKWVKASTEYVIRSKNNVIDIKELGSVVVMPLPITKLKGATIMILPLILHKLNEVHIYSSYFKYEQVQHDFGSILASALLNKTISNISMAGLDINWKVVVEYFGKLASSGLGNVFEPHIQTYDLEKNSIEEYLYRLEPALHFWFGNDCLGIPYAKGCVSFNLMDVATNFVNKLKYGDNSTKYLNESLWDELLKRYLSEEPLQEQVLQQIDNQLVGEEFSQPNIAGTVFA